jgi:uncharacterized membrane protein YgdD (TMEM256/DUF423 family)
MRNSTALRFAAVAGLLAVVLGAFGAHALKNVLNERKTTDIWEKAVFYHLIHAVMLFILAERSLLRVGPWCCLAAGVLIFSGTLYLLAVTNLRWLGVITPLGGISLMAGWAWLAIEVGKAPRSNNQESEKQQSSGINPGG